MIKSAEIQRPYPLGHGGRLEGIEIPERKFLVTVVVRYSTCRSTAKKFISVYLIQSKGVSFIINALAVLVLD